MKDNIFIDIYFYTNNKSIINEIDGETNNSDIYKFVYTDKPHESDIAIVYGGDGTLLRTINNIYTKNINYKGIIIGVNTGHVGFLANDIDNDILINILKNYPNIEDNIHEYQFLVINNNPYKYFAVNEIAVVPKDRGRLFEVNIDFNGYKGELVFKGDGLIVSTPIGSTAYNLSAGGTIIHPSIHDCYQLTPICPFTLSARPIILKNETIILTPKSKFELYLDGRLIDYKYNNIAVSLSNFIKYKLFKYETSFIKAIQNKLGWNSNIKS